MRRTTDPIKGVRQVTLVLENGETITFRGSGWGKVHSTRLEVGGKEIRSFSLDLTIDEQSMVGDRSSRVIPPSQSILETSEETP